MKANELMIGDWVRIKGLSTFLMVRMIGEYRIGVCTNKMGDYLIYNEDEIEPIPLTPEILEKNGFEYGNGGYVYDNYEGILIAYSTFISRLRIIKDLNILYDSQDYADIYVHTIQHALRLCGIEKEITI